ncbi:GTP-binding protein [Thalassotalea euphylliae]|uniref:GTP-binding protein n=1 Tax=Thalassotalea euphylliae TaxID=1655234 RepID=A0A3E0TSW2_9GAMM|nr:GTP-binding protein [Thalassotalea euphylliae]REL27736.1 GTP-binding protein [Thalassotalea euphylliae]
MPSTNDKILAVPTNIITGFLGVGKTSAILHLLKQKPTHERWAILVNEFGEIGVDGSLFQGQSTQAQSAEEPAERTQRVFIKEVPGGCMCCASGLPMQIALNLLLNEAKPDRLLIEPTGLGHPVEVLQLLSNQYYSEILDLQKTITLVDARNLADNRYTAHATFNQQISIADMVVGNKVDLYSEVHEKALNTYLVHLKAPDAPEQQLVFTEHGKIELAWLAGKTAHLPVKHRHHHHNHHGQNKRKNEPIAAEKPLPASGYLTAVNQGEGFNSVGWRFAPDKIFDREQLLIFLTGITAERIKGVFITSDGIFGYNSTRDGLTEIALDECLESRIEIICANNEVETQQWEQTLTAALVC